MMIFAVPLAAAISFLVSLWFIKKADRIGLIDVPNMRSSHTRPTPRGGGIGIVLGAAAAMVVCFLAGIIESSFKYTAIIGGFLAAALLGFYSDKHNISALSRIVLQVLIVVITIGMIGCPKSLSIGGFIIRTGCMATVYGSIWLVAAINFYNFMDGIDGLAAAQGVISGIAIALFGVVLDNGPLIPMGLVLSGASAGFLLLNFPPARIFMGDAGSYALGFYIASFSLIDKRLVIPIVMVLGVFIFDTVVTLTKRIVRGEEWYQAHREHFYQRAVKLGYSHLQVTLAISAASALLTAMAYAYLQASPPVQIAILLAASAVLTAMALWVVLKERTAVKR